MFLEGLTRLLLRKQRAPGPPGTVLAPGWAQTASQDTSLRQGRPEASAGETERVTVSPARWQALSTLGSNEGSIWAAPALQLEERPPLAEHPVQRGPRA